MVTKFLFAAVVLVPVIGWALPGDVVTAIAPRFDARASESVVALDASGVIHLWAGVPSLDGLEIAALDGAETGGIIRLAADGTTAAILAPELLQAGKNQGIPLSPWVVSRSDLRFLADGRLMVCTPDRGGVLVTPDGVASSGFFKNLPIASRVSPQFERGVARQNVLEICARCSGKNRFSVTRR